MFGSAKKRRGLSSPSSPAAFAERSPPTTPKADDNDDDKYAPKKEVVVLQSPASQDMEFRKEAERLERVLSKFADQGEEMAPTFLKPIFQYLPRIGINILVILRTMYPLALKLSEYYLWCQENLPVELITAGWGLILCFFGGTFQLSLAAYEAFKVNGWDRTRGALVDLHETWKEFQSANSIDDKKDDDNDGISDVDQISSTELVTRKVKLFLKVSDPNKVHDALTGISSGFVGVIATLKFKYARTVTLGCTIGNYLRRPAGMYLTPTLVQVSPVEFRKWLPHLIDYGCKFVAISIAWFVSAVLASVQSSIRGGLMFSRSMMKLAAKNGWLDIDPDESYLDEVVGWSLAFCGASFQIINGFGLPFPLNLLLLPFSFIEYYLKWIVSSKD
ncbi:hypothetical protein TL16_g01012 [Triparma laevis f. inornata]|uniref:Uncharacterized protein n=2 Tax=Triparma laevis TaxID=1534972 RepID=A0A9W7FRW2_9STRA|nr:hypothetical protein TL16_g01012 [Triparma laevis f. inornata]GMI16856.1 hypothetical protein TrLO_g1689 [Triparma laevis f. longispina]